MTPMTKEQLKDYKEIDGVLEYRPNKFKIYWDRWLTSWADLIDGLTGVLTLGLWKTNVSFKMICYQAKRNLNRRIAFENSDKKEKEYHQRPGF